jgi:two-component system NarL family sensor kinase
MVKTQDLTLIIILSMLFTFIMILVIVMLAKKNRKIQELSDQLINEEKAKNEIEKLEVALATQETERSQIARMLHDDVGAILSLAQKNIFFIKKQAKNGVFEHQSIDLTGEFIQESINQLRRINKGLIPHYLLKFGLVKALERMAKQKTDTLVESFIFNTHLPDKLILSDQIMTQYFYITSELITNLIKHSYPTNIEMDLNLEDGVLILKIQHNGIALAQRDFNNLSKDSDSLGLENIRYRLEVIKGEISFFRSKTLGFIEIHTKLNN